MGSTWRSLDSRSSSGIHCRMRGQSRWRSAKHPLHRSIFHLISRSIFMRIYIAIRILFSVSIPFFPFLYSKSYIYMIFIGLLEPGGRSSRNPNHCPSRASRCPTSALQLRAADLRPVPIRQPCDAIEVDSVSAKDAKMLRKSLRILLLIECKYNLYRI